MDEVDLFRKVLKKSYGHESTTDVKKHRTYHVPATLQGILVELWCSKSSVDGVLVIVLPAASTGLS
jgi:hypothetical protein